MAISSSQTKDLVWKGLYTAALFEDDSAKVPGLIARAESEIVERARMLFGEPGNHAAEMQALDSALHMLQALKSCCKVATVDRETAS